MPAIAQVMEEQKDEHQDMMKLIIENNVKIAMHDLGFEPKKAETQRTVQTSFPQNFISPPKQVRRPPPPVWLQPIGGEQKPLPKQARHPPPPVWLQPTGGEQNPKRQNAQERVSVHCAGSCHRSPKP